MASNPVGLGELKLPGADAQMWIPSGPEGPGALGATLCPGALSHASSQTDRCSPSKNSTVLLTAAAASLPLGGCRSVRSPAFFPPAQGWAPLMPGVTIKRAWAGPLSGQALPPLAFTQPESDPGRSPAVAALPEPGFEMCFPGTRFAAETEVSNRKGGEDFSACFSRANGPFKPVITAMHLTAGERGGSRSCSHFPGTPAYREAGLGRGGTSSCNTGPQGREMIPLRTDWESAYDSCSKPSCVLDKSLQPGGSFQRAFCSS